MNASPFPGMDPYLERHWLDVHTKLVAYAADDLNERIPESLHARTEERVAIESDEQALQLAPDVRVLEQVERPSASSSPGAGGAGVLSAPFTLVAITEPLTERFIEIRENETDRLITVIEMVSPTNKRGEGLRAFRAKRAELLAAGVHFVEIDLVREGNWRELLRPHVCPREAVAPFRAAIRLGRDPRAAVHLYPMALREPLPKVPVPLRPADEPVNLDLHSLVERAYRNGRYARTLDYRRAPEPPLDSQDAAWVDELLRAAGKR